MRRLMVFCCMVFIVIFFYPQSLQIIYKVKYKPRLESSVFQEEYMNLDISKSYSIFYNVNHANFVDKDPVNYLRFYVENKNESIWYYGNLNEFNFKYKDNSKRYWKILKEKSEILGFKVRKAELEFEDRKWEAWFTDEISIPYGPYKFSGLPGVVLKIISLDGEYNFEAISVEKDKNSFTEFPKKFIEVRKEKVDEYISEFVKDPASKSFVGTNDYGDSYEYKYQGFNTESYINTAFFIRRIISNYNNPIDKKTFIVIY